MVARLKNLLGVFVAARPVLRGGLSPDQSVHAPASTTSERFILLDGGIYTQLFWIGQILIGGVLPLVHAVSPKLGHSRA